VLLEINLLDSNAAVVANAQQSLQEPCSFTGVT